MSAATSGILVINIDDDAASREVAAALLEHAGYRVMDFERVTLPRSPEDA